MIENHYTVPIPLVCIDITAYISPDYQQCDFLDQVRSFSSCDRDRTMWCVGPPLAHIFSWLDTEFILISESMKCDGTNSWLLSKGVQQVISLIFLMVNIHCWIGEVCVYDYILNSAS